MLHAEIIIGNVYAVKVSGRLAPVRITHDRMTTAFGTRASQYSTPRNIAKFYGVNEKTGRKIGPFTSRKCRFEVSQLPSGVWARKATNAV